jgi:hypothetical protein
MGYPGLELKYSDGIAGARTMIALEGNAAALLCECQVLFRPITRFLHFKISEDVL